MKVLFDTSVTMPCLWPWHENHSNAFAWWQAVKSKRVELVLAAHTLAETYSVSTRLPSKYRVAPLDAWTAIERTLIAHAEIIDVPAALYLKTLSELAQSGRGGGLVYDALIVAAAERTQVDYLLTYNYVHFRWLWPLGHQQIATPDIVSPP